MERQANVPTISELIGEESHRLDSYFKENQTQVFPIQIQEVGE